MSADNPFAGPDGKVELGETRGERRLHGLADSRAATLALVQATRRSLRIFTDDLDGDLLGDEEIVAAASAMARRNSYTFIRILLHDPRTAVQTSNPLIRLIRALPSHIGVRRTAPEWADEPAAFIVADNHGLLHRSRADQFEGTIDFAAGATAVQYRDWFDHVWEHSQPETEFRALGI